MGAYLGLRDSWFWEDDAILDAIETLQDQADGTFYPAEYGPEGHTDIACPNLWGYLIPQEESEPFERLFAAREDEQVAKLYGTRFAYARWYNGADGEPKVGFLPAPVSREEPLAGGVGKKATWARFWTWGPALEDNIDMSFFASGEDSSFFSAPLSFSSAAASGELSGLEWDELFIRMPPLFMPVYASRDRK